MDQIATLPYSASMDDDVDTSLGPFVAHLEDGRGTTFALREGENYVGREPWASQEDENMAAPFVQLMNDGIEKRHAVVEVRLSDGDALIRRRDGDTYVGDIPCRRRISERLEIGDALTLGDARFTFRWGLPADSDDDEFFATEAPVGSAPAVIERLKEDVKQIRKAPVRPQRTSTPTAALLFDDDDDDDEPEPEPAPEPEPEPQPEPPVETTKPEQVVEVTSREPAPETTAVKETRNDDEVVTAVTVKKRSPRMTTRKKVALTESNEKKKTLTGQKKKKKRNDSQETSSKKKRQRNEAVVLVTGVTSVSKVQLTRMIEKFGGREATSPLEATHVVTETTLKRTPKLLAAIAVARHVVSVDWVQASADQGRPRPEHEFVVKDRANEAKWGFDLARSLQSSARILHGYAVALAPGVRGKKKVPDDAEINHIVNAAGGTYLNTLPTTSRTSLRTPDVDACPCGLLVIADRTTIETEQRAAQQQPNGIAVGRTPRLCRKSTAIVSTVRRATVRRARTDDDDVFRALSSLPTGLLTGIIDPEALWCALLRKHLDLAADVLPGDGLLHDLARRR